MRRKSESISEYISKFNLSISESYYRDIETGRKVARIDTALALCEALELNKNDLFFYLLKDILPNDVFDSLIKPNQKRVFDTVTDEVSLLASDLEVMRNAYLKTLIEKHFQGDDEDVINYLSNNFELLPIIHFVYMREQCSRQDIQEIIRRNEIKKDIRLILKEFKELQIAEVDEDHGIIKRNQRMFNKIPKTASGIAFRDKFLIHEITTAMRDKRSSQVVSSNNTFIWSGITCFDVKESQFQRRVADLIATFSAEEVNLEDENAVPFFVSLLVSSRENYDVKN
jgi:DNA-binding XRE family transcriptional regulator